MTRDICLTITFYTYMYFKQILITTFVFVLFLQVQHLNDISHVYIHVKQSAWYHTCLRVLKTEMPSWQLHKVPLDTTSALTSSEVEDAEQNVNKIQLHFYSRWNTQEVRNMLLLIIFKEIGFNLGLIYIDYCSSLFQITT